jgi:FMN-dependent NADH-azoreductase
MPTFLHLDSSPMGALSVSRTLSQFFTERWLEANPGATVLRRDLTTTPIPPVSEAWVTAVYTPADQRTVEQKQELALSDLFVSELKQADEYVIGMPFHNFNIPSVLKLWLDQLYRPGETYEYVDGKPTGLLQGKKAVILMASGGVYTEGTRLAPLNHAKPYLKTMLGIFGVTDVTFLEAGGTKALRSGDIDREVFLRPHLAAIQAHLDGNPTL